MQRTPPAPSVVAVATALAKGAALAPRGGKAYVMMHKGWPLGMGGQRWCVEVFKCFDG